MKRPWSIASTSKMMVEGIERRCNWWHKHVIAGRRECKLAELYTVPFARRAHALLRMIADGKDTSQKDGFLVEHDFAAAEEYVAIPAVPAATFAQACSGCCAPAAPAPSCGRRRRAAAKRSTTSRPTWSRPSLLSRRLARPVAARGSELRERAAPAPLCLQLVLQELVGIMPSYITHGELRGQPT